MHKSKLAGFIIDCETEDLEAAAEFWGSALGMDLHYFDDQQASNYVKLVDPDNNMHIEVQSVDHPSRVHLDIETDDIDAEVERLKGLGAKEVSRIKRWCVMEAPTGQRFCVVRKCTANFDAKAHQW